MQYEEGLDYVVEDGLWVWTEEFLRKRGYCCDNGCKNCPYRKEHGIFIEPPKNP